MIKKGEQIKIVKKLDDYSAEYEVGDIFVVNDIWYGGVHITGKTGVPVSLDAEEFEPLIGKDDTKESDKVTSNIKKVIFHVNELAKVKIAIANMENMLAYYDKKKEEVTVKIELLLNGEAVKAVEKNGALDVMAFQKKGIKVFVCQNSLRANGILENSLQTEVTIVSTGVVTLAEKQWEGYAYIRP